MRKRILSFILTLCMVMALMPATVQVSAASHTNHCICGASHIGVGDHNTKDEKTFNEWTSTTSLPDSGNYYLTENVDLSSTWEPTGDIVLCLNGHTITGPSESYLIEVNNGVTFTLTDCTQSGKIVGGAPHTISIIGTFNMYGGSIIGSSYYGVLNEGSFNMYGGSVTENTGIFGGGVENDSSATFNMNGGSITKNSDSGVRNKGTFNMNSGEIAENTGHGVYNESSATFNMNGGSITENKTRGVYNAGTFTMSSGEIARNIVGGNGGGVFNANDAIFNMNGGSIIENIARPYSGQTGCAGVYNAGTFTISGNAIIQDNKKEDATGETLNNVFLQAGKNISIGSALTSGASIGVTVQTPPTGESSVDITSGGSSDYSSYFFSDDTNYEIYNDNNTVKLRVKTTNVTEIASVDVALGIPTPKDALASRATVFGTGIATTNPTITWKKGSETTTEIARYNTVYTANVMLSAESGYAFDSDVTANIKATDGSTIGSGTVTDNGDGTITVSYTFAATPKANIKNIAKPKDITGVANGTKKTAQALGLPSTVTIGTEDENKIAAITWDMVNLAEGTYDPAVKNEQSFKVNGTVTLPDDVANGNNIPLKVTVGVTVKAAEVTAVPETLSFGYAYDVQKELVYPKGAGSTMDFSDMEKPLAENGSRKDNYAGEWTLAKAGTYSYLKMYMEKSKMDITNLESVVTKVVTEYGWTEEQKNGCVIYELKDGEKHVAYGILLAYDTEKERAVFVGDNLSGGVGYLLTKRELHVSPGIVGYTIAVTKSVKDFAEKSEYQMLEGTDGKWEQNSEETLSFRVDCDFHKFIGVMVDNKLVDAKDYTAKSGSTIVTLKGDFLKSLSAGSHKMTTVFTDGECTTVFEVKEVAEEGKNNPTETTKPENDKNDTTGTLASASNSTNTANKNTTENGTDNKTDSPKTGDSTDMVWLMIMVGFLGMGLILAAKKGKRDLKGLR